MVMWLLRGVMAVVWASACGTGDEGELKWSFNTGDGVFSSPTASLGADGTVYVGSFDGKLYAVTAEGVKKWSFATEGEVDSSPALGLDGTVYVGSDDGRLYAVTAEGGLKWSFTTRGRVYSSPALGPDGTVYVGSFDHNLYAVTAEGGLKWNFTTGERIDSSPALGPDGTVYVGSVDHRLYAFCGTVPPEPEPEPQPGPQPECCDRNICDHKCFHGGACIPGVSFPDPDRAWCDCDDTGYSGSTCSIPDFKCCHQGKRGRCLQSCFNKGKCLAHPQPEAWCNCSGTGFGGETCHTPEHPPDPKVVATAWLVACVVVTVCGSCSVVCFIRHHGHTLRSLRPICLPENDREQSYCGAFSFLCGIVDLMLSMKTCYSMFSCEELQGSFVLALCFLAALVVNYSATVILAFHTLNHIRESRRANTLTTLLRPRASTASSTTRTALGFRRLLPLIVIGSIPRLQSLAMLRLRLFGVEVLNYPMEDRHMFFIRNSGLHHLFVVDIPIVVIGSALIHSTIDDGQPPCEGGSLDWTRATLWCKCVLMVWSLVSTITQLLLTGNCGTSIRGGRDVNGVLEIETVASVLRTSVSSLRTTRDGYDRTSRWVDEARVARRSDGSARSSIRAVGSERSE